MVKTIMKDSTLNFDDLIAFHTTEADTLTDSKEEPLNLKFRILNSKDANFFLMIRMLAKKLLKIFSFEIPYIGWDQTEK
jgi:hypothetical protein